MNRDIKRHKILEILSRQYLACEDGSQRILGVTFEKIANHVKCEEKSLQELSSVLYKNQEVGYHDAYDVIGMYAKESGVASYADKKYLKLAYKNKVDIIKDIIQIVIPVISLLVALGAIYFKADHLNKENDQKIKKLEEKIQKLEDKQKVSKRGAG